MEYIKIVDGIIKDHVCSSVELSDEYIKVDRFMGIVGDKSDWYDENYVRIPDSELISRGIRKDNTGRYYSTEDPNNSYVITSLDEEPKEGYTEQIPKQYDKWDGKKWKEDSEAKEKAEDIQRYHEAITYLKSTDYNVIKCLESGNKIQDAYPKIYEERSKQRDIASKIKDKYNL